MTKKICKDCGYVGKTKTIRKGSIFSEIGLFLIGIILCLVFIPIGIIVVIGAIVYSIIRTVACREEVCPECLHPNCMVPLDSRAGQKLLKEYEIDIDKIGNKNNEDDFWADDD